MFLAGLSGAYFYEEAKGRQGRRKEGIEALS